MKKSIRFLMIAATLALSFTALTSSRVAAQTTNLTLEGWSSSPAENQLLQQIVDSYNKSNPDTQVKLNQVPDYDTTLAKDLASGSPPDVFYVDEFRLPDLVNAGALQPIGDKLQNTDDFYPSLKAAFTFNGAFYCPPKDFSTLALFINTDMMAKANIKAPPTTWDELAADAKAMTSGGVAGIVLPNDLARWAVYLYQAGGSVTDDNFTRMTINSPEALQALKFYADLYTNGYGKTPQDLGDNSDGDSFGKGHTAMAVTGNWEVPALKTAYANIKYMVAELPAGPKGKATMAFTVCYAVPATAKNADASLKLVNYLTGSDGMKAWTDLGLAMPTRQSLSAGWLQKFPDLKPFLDGASYAHKWQFVPGFQAVLDKTNNDILSVFSGQMTPEDALKDIEDIGNQVLAQNKTLMGGGAATQAATP